MLSRKGPPRLYYEAPMFVKWQKRTKYYRNPGFFAHGSYPDPLHDLLMASAVESHRVDGNHAGVAFASAGSIAASWQPLPLQHTRTMAALPRVGGVRRWSVWSSE